LKLAIDGRNLQSLLSSACDVGRDFVARDCIDLCLAQERECEEVFDSVSVKTQRVPFFDETGIDERQEIVRREIGKCRNLNLVANPNLTLRERRFVRGFHLLGDSLVRLLRALSNQFAVPDELVPPSFRIPLLENHVASLYCAILLECTRSCTLEI
jgi:hypothetical protein